jgi:hypothetical protein
MCKYARVSKNRLSDERSPLPQAGRGFPENNYWKRPVTDWGGFYPKPLTVRGHSGSFLDLTNGAETTSSII